MRSGYWFFLVVVVSIGCKKTAASSAILSSSSFALPFLDSTPYLHKDTILIFGLDKISAFRIPSLGITNKGTVLAVADGRVPNSNDLPNEIHCVMRRSTNNGKSWSKLTTLLAYPDGEGTGDPSLLIDRETGKIWVFVNFAGAKVGQANSQPGYGDNTIHTLAITSDDDGLTWSAPVDITQSVKDPAWAVVISSPGHGIQLRDGTLVQTAYMRKAKSTVFYSFFFYSKDHGRTWERSSPVGANTGENMLVELEDGSLMANMRSYRGRGCRAESVTADLGKTWSPVKDCGDLPDPVCEGTTLRLKNASLGNDTYPILFSNCADSRNRVKLTLRLSGDDCKTWTYSRVLCEGNAGYSDAVLLADGTIGVFYEQGNLMVFAKVNTNWIAGGH